MEEDVKKAELLGIRPEELDEVERRLSLQAIELLVRRYLLRRDGRVVERPRDMFARVAAMAAIPEILYDPRVFSREGGSDAASVDDSEVPDELLVADGDPPFLLNEYHVRALRRMYERLAGEGKVRVSWRELVAAIRRGEFADKYGVFKAFYDIMATLRFLPNSPTLFNAGTRIGSLSACFVVPIADDLGEIMRAARDAALIFQSGGGVGLDFSPLRPKGDVVRSTEGAASGPVSFIELIDKVADVVKQGGRRRGACMGVLASWHPDVEEFIAAKLEEGRLTNFNLSVRLDERFWESYEAGREYELVNPRDGSVWKRVDPRKLLREMAEAAWRSGDPGVLFEDNINRRNVLRRALGDIKATNPCLAGSVRIYTPDGPIPISNLVGKEVEVLADPRAAGPVGVDEELRAVVARGIVVPRGRRRVVDVVFEDGRSVRVTPDHRFLVLHSVGDRAEFVWKRADELRTMDAVASAVPHALASDSVIEKLRAALAEARVVRDGFGHVSVFVDDPESFVEMARFFGASEAGLAQGRAVSMTESSYRNLEAVASGEGPRGVTPTEAVAIVKEVRDAGEEEVYDVAGVVPLHAFYAEGVLVHNCGEEPLYPYESCNLGSLNLRAYVVDGPGGRRFDWKRFREDIALATRFLDNIIDVNDFPLPEIAERTRATRKIGLGVMGLASTLFALGIRYNSERGFEFMERVAENLTYYSMLASTRLAEERGPFPLFEESGYVDGELPVEGPYSGEPTLDWESLKRRIVEVGMRNAETTTVAPTGSISMIAGVSSGIEPQFALIYEKRVTVGRFFYVDPDFRAALEERGLLREDVIEAVAANGGSLSGLDFIPDDLREVFVTAHDIPWWDHVRAQAVVARWICAAVSKTINMPHDVTVEDVERAFVFAHRMGLKGITIYRDGSKSEQVIVTGVRRAEPGGAVNRTVEMLQELAAAAEPRAFDGGGGLFLAPPSAPVPRAANGGGLSVCPECGSPLVRSEGCLRCPSCGWSACSVS